ncbi:uncharacterized protein N7529_009272 [Penicillium soppii]|uniref:uncharacterized protein n=1 Tax=Penicillium soppii TaxID=69789 RepID=UPI002546C2DA|nr:uncharacterized protein N7529_009272 [Penicillium soppii]KAJ5855328.1 hypothetical protein N7529_009272 [Penicillium soppii]
MDNIAASALVEILGLEVFTRAEARPRQKQFEGEHRPPAARPARAEGRRMSLLLASHSFDLRLSLLFLESYLLGRFDNVAFP